MPKFFYHLGNVEKGDPDLDGLLGFGLVIYFSFMMLAYASGGLSNGPYELPIVISMLMVGGLVYKIRCVRRRNRFLDKMIILERYKDSITYLPPSVYNSLSEKDKKHIHDAYPNIEICTHRRRRKMTNVR